MGQWGAAMKYKGVVFLPYIETGIFESATSHHLIADIYILDIDKGQIVKNILLEVESKYRGYPYSKWINALVADNSWPIIKELLDTICCIGDSAEIMKVFDAEIIMATRGLSDKEIRLLIVTTEKAIRDIQELMDNGLAIIKALDLALYKDILPPSVKYKIVFLFIYKEGR